MNYKKLFFLLVLPLPMLSISQVDGDSPLFLQIEALDSLLFERGFNECEISAFEAHISEDLEFYHDQGGLSTTRAEFLNDVKQNICSSPQRKPIRRLKEGSLQIFPLYDQGVLYGAIQKGEHDFFIREPGKEPYQTSTAKFTHVWLLQGELWILKRVLSYDHSSPP